MFEVQDSIEEELSDVIVMMIQLQYLFNIDNDTINKIADEKLKRTLILVQTDRLAIFSKDRKSTRLNSSH